MARKPKKEQKGASSPAWMATYGDLMSLLLSFFILLFSFSSIQESKFREAMASLQGSFGVLETYPTTPIHDHFETIRSKPEQFYSLEEDLQEKVEQLREQVEALKQSDSVVVSRSEKGLAIRLDSQLLFDLSKADLRAEAEPVLRGLVRALANMPNSVRVEGHTDNLPIASTQFPSNWELSAARAAAVVRYFESQGMDPRKLSAAGFGEWKPVARNDSPEERQKNRRVEIFVDLLPPDANSPGDLGQLGE